MKVNKLISALSLEPLVVPNAESEVGDGYVGDLLSWVVGRASAGSVWLTVMGNQNAVAVAAMADLPLIVLVEGSRPDELMLSAAAEQGIALAASKLSAFELARELTTLI